MGEDPFLPVLTDHTRQDHARQESGDSGLSVSMSHTPDFLSSIDDSMDGLSGELNFFRNEAKQIMNAQNFVFHLIEK